MSALSDSEFHLLSLALGHRESRSSSVNTGHDMVIHHEWVPHTHTGLRTYSSQRLFVLTVKSSALFLGGRKKPMNLKETQMKTIYRTMQRQ